MLPDSHCRSVDPFLIVEPSAAGSSKNMLTKYNLVLQLAARGLTEIYPTLLSTTPRISMQASILHQFG